MAKRQKHELSLFPPPDSPAGQHYFYVTQRPWPSLVFILPMLVIFELMTYARHGGHLQGSSELVAAYIIEWLVNSLGTSGFYFPGMLVIAILLAWHVAARHPWRFDVTVLPGMLGESVVWTLPLFVFNRILHIAVLAGSTASPNTWVDQMIRGIGAGLYEELVFRLIAITALVIVLVDVLKFPRVAAAVIILVASATLFAAQHHPPLGSEQFDWARFIFRTAAGLYLAGLFVFRGFGIAAGCHALYNVIAVTIDAAQT